MTDKKTRLPAPQRHEQILQIAMELFAEKGFENTTTKEISEKAGITERLVFRHFPTKDAMWQELFERWKETGKKRPPVEIVNNSAIDTLKTIAEKWIIPDKYGRPGGNAGSILRDAVQNRHGVDDIVLDAIRNGPDYVTNDIMPVVIFGQHTGEIRQGDPRYLSSAFFAFFCGISHQIYMFGDKFEVPPIDVGLDMLRTERLEVIRRT